VHHGHTTRIRLTTRERQLVAAILAGCRNKDIARQHGVSEQTVKNQLKTLYRKAGVSSRLELAMRVVTGHLVAEDECS
jgi:DNA-binding NarL/FixJ family response regulator